MAESELINPAANEPEPASSGSTHRRPAGVWRFGAAAALCAVAGLGLDQLTKFMVVSGMREGEVIDVVPPLLRWHFIRNSGAAFSMGEGYTWVFTLIMIAVSAYVIYLLFRVRSMPWAIGLGCLLGGALGNLTDRLFREPSFGQGHVVDFIAFPRFAIFNIADSFIVCSMVFICWLMFRGMTLDGRPEPAGPGNGAQ